MTQITAYTDGSATTFHPYLGGFGIYFPHGNIRIKKGWSHTKTGRQELYAVLYCLRSIKNKQAKVTIYSDSQYVCNTVNEWIEGWERNMWYDKKNVDILKQLLIELRKFAYYPRLIHIKGHQEVTCKHTKGNSLADELANYRNHSSYEVDITPTGLNEIEKQDYFEKDGKMYLKPDLYQITKKNKNKTYKEINDFMDSRDCDTTEIDIY
jgi:ribonuclease HI